MGFFSARRSPPVPVDIITYRFNNEMVYVSPPRSFDEAVASARAAFPRVLAIHPEGQVYFTINMAFSSQESRAVGISPSAWPTIASRLKPYDIIDIHIMPEIEASPTPSYLSHSLIDGMEGEQRLTSQSSLSHQLPPSQRSQQSSGYFPTPLEV